MHCKQRTEYILNNAANRGLNVLPINCYYNYAANRGLNILQMWLNLLQTLGTLCFYQQINNYATSTGLNILQTRVNTSQTESWVYCIQIAANRGLNIFHNNAATMGLNAMSINCYDNYATNRWLNIVQTWLNMLQT